MKRWLRDAWKGLGLADVLGFLGVGLAIVALVQNPNLQANATIYIFGLYITILATSLAWREFVYSRKARYAEASVNLHHCAGLLRDAHDAISRSNREQVDDRVRDSLIAFADAFSLITGANCRACIKTIVAETGGVSGGEPNFMTETLRRSTTALRGEADKPAPIRENTDFLVLFDGRQEYFLSHDLTEERAYMNSNWPNNPDERAEFIRARKFKYITTLVWPIKIAPLSGTKPNVIGFLCVDSLTRHIFERRYDTELGAAIADMLYPLLLRYREMLGNKQPGG
jgi:hypothetical protein